MRIVDGWIDEAIEIGYDNKSMSRQGYKVTHLVLHGTAGGSSAEGIANYFATSDVQASAHIIIGQDGHIVQGVSMNDAAWGNGVVTEGHASWLPPGNPNFWSISIEFVKSATDNSSELTAIQAQKGFEVIKCICDAYSIPKRFADGRGGICKHADIDPVNRSRCPNVFPWTNLWNYLAGQPAEEQDMIIDLKTPGVSQFFEGTDNTIWKCKANGFLVGHAILDFYRKFGNNGLCGLTHLGLPRSNEMNTDKPNTVIQRFERGVLCYDQGKTIDNPPGAGGVYLMHIDSGLGQDSRIGPLQSQNAQLRADNTDLQKENADLKALDEASLKEELDAKSTELDAANDKLGQIKEIVG